MAATIENKVTEKVAYFQELKAGMNGKIKIESEIYIHSLVEDVLGVFQKNELKSENAGYEIHENADGDGLSFLGDRVEINLASGESFNVWIDKIACYADSHSLPFLGFMRDTAIEKGDSNITDFWTSVIEYRLKDHKDAEMWRKILGLESDGNAEITTCLDDYFVNSDDAADVEIENEINNRLAEEKKRQDFIKSVLNMGGLDSNKKIKLIPQEYYNYGEPETLTARKVAFRSFDYYQMDSGNYNIRIIPQGHEAMSWVAAYKTEAQAQEVIKMLGAAIQRGDETFTFPEVEEVEEIKATVAAESKQFEVGKWYYNCSVLSSGGLAYKVTHRTKKMVTLTDSFGEVIRRKPETTFGVEEISLDAYEMLEATRFCTNADEIQKAEDDLAYSLGQDAEDDAKDERRQELITAYYAGKNAVDEVETDSDDLAEVEEVTTEKNPLKEKIAEILNRPRRSCIDWTDAIFQNVTLPEIFKAQKELKKFLKLGQLDLAENIFAMLKTLCKNYREQFAA